MGGEAEERERERERERGRDRWASEVESREVTMRKGREDGEERDEERERVGREQQMEKAIAWELS